MQLYNYYILIYRIVRHKVNGQDKYIKAQVLQSKDIKTYQSLKTCPEPEHNSALPNSQVDLIYYIGMSSPSFLQ